MTSQRCSICAINYPPTERFTSCPRCEEPTTRMFQAEPISDEEANRIWSFAEFERRHGPAEVEA
jgi:hypothetical protein